MPKKLILLLITACLSSLVACENYNLNSKQSVNSVAPSDKSPNSIEMIKSNAAKGDLDAQVILAMMYESGFIIPKDVKRATDLYAKAAELGHDGAQYRMGLFYFSGGGQGITQDIKRSMDFYTKAAEQGHKEAQIALAQHYKDNSFGDPDLEKAKHWSQKAASGGGAEGYAELASLELKGSWSLNPETGLDTYVGDLQDFVRAEKNFIKAAELGDSNSQFGLCLIYRTGLGVVKNLKSAEKWCEKAALNATDGASHQLGLVYEEQKNYTKAIYWYEIDNQRGYQRKHVSQYNLARLYYDGLGVKKDYEKALFYYQKAAEEDGLKPPVDTKYYLGLMYKNGLGTPKDLNQAIVWLKKAANDNHAKAQFELAMIYLNDKDRTENFYEAVTLLEMAARTGYVPAQFRLGKLYADGKGIAQDYGRAADWYARAAAQNNPDAQNNLGTLYYNGRGVTQDYSQAAKWYEKAAAQKHADAQNSLAFLYYYGLGVPRSIVAAHALHKMATSGHLTYENESSKNLNYAESLAQNELDDSQKLTDEMMKANNFLKALNEYVIKAK